MGMRRGDPPAPRSQGSRQEVKQKEEIMRRSMLMLLVSMALCLTAADLATAAGGPVSDQKSSFQAQSPAQPVAQSRIVMRPGAFGTMAPVLRLIESQPATPASSCRSDGGYDSCTYWYEICVEAAHTQADRDHCANIRPLKVSEFVTHNPKLLRACPNVRFRMHFHRQFDWPGNGNHDPKQTLAKCEERS